MVKKGETMRIKETLGGLRRAPSGGREGTDREIPIATTAETGGRVQTRHPRRDPDIPLDRIEKTYIPPQTSLKGPFRSNGDERLRDQEFAGGIADDRWNDEDRFTNKSGDPRIGTHGRTYEPGEARTPKH